MVFVHQFHGAEQSWGGFLGCFGVPAGHLFCLLGRRLIAGWDPYGAGGGNGAGGVELVEGVVYIDDNLEAGGRSTRRRSGSGIHQLMKGSVWKAAARVSANAGRSWAVAFWTWRSVACSIA
jgi:hypothetical protein